MSSYLDLINTLSANEAGESRIKIPASWMQGRATFGGLSAAIAYEAVIKAHSDLPPLRSLQIAFVGPVGGEVRVKTEILRQGRSVSFVGADIVGAEGLSSRVIFAFGAARASIFNQSYLPAPDVLGPEELPDLFGEMPQPSFARHFETRLARGDAPFSGSEQNEVLIWVRHKDPLANTLSSLIALGDMPPPAMLPRFTKFAPISSMNWSMNFSMPEPVTTDRWWLLRTCAEDAKDGYSSQDMTVWNRAGDFVIGGRQSVAMFL